MTLDLTVRVDALPRAWQQTVVTRLAALAGVALSSTTGRMPELLEPQLLPDVAIDLTAAPLPGTWQLRDGMGRPLAAPAAYAAASLVQGSVELTLVDEVGRVLERAVLRAEEPPVVRERARVLASALVVRAVAARLRGRQEQAAPAVAPADRRPPRRVQDVAVAAARRVLSRARSWLVDETWAVGLVDRPITSFLDHPTLVDARWLEPPRGGYIADPFGLPDGETILVEHLDHAENVGRLEAISLAGTVRDPQPFDPPIPGHASFPFLAAGDDGDLFCLPESAATARLELWRYQPDGRFRPFANVATDIAAADPTLFWWDGRWWIAFADAGPDGGAHDTLCLLYADALHGPWRPHACNPVKIDVGSSRPAGTPFVRDGQLYRPAQDCTGRYGAAIVINRVRELDPERFAEEPAARIAPDPASPFPHGAHTLSAWGGRTLVDAKREGFAAAACRRRVLRWVRLPAAALVGRHHGGAEELPA